MIALLDLRTMKLVTIFSGLVCCNQFIADVKFAAVSSCPASTLYAWNCGVNCEGLVANTKVFETFSFDSTDTVGYIAVNEDLEEIIVSYRGSKGLKNWLNNLKMAKLDWPLGKNVRVHYGFFQSWKSSKTFVEHQLDILLTKYPTFTVLFTGHSLGGALASLAAFHFKETRNQRQANAQFRLVTIGAPRIGNQEFADSFLNENVSRIVNFNDLIPKLPFHGLGFRHSAQEIWIGEDSKSYQTCSKTSGEDPKCSRSISFERSSLNSHKKAWSIKMAC